MCSTGSGHTGRAPTARQRRLRPIVWGFGAWAACLAAVAGEPAVIPTTVPTAEETSVLPTEQIMLISGSDSGTMTATLDRIQIVEPGTSSRTALQAARAALPLGRLTPARRRQAQAVLDELSMFRTLPTLRMATDHSAYRYFVEHPDVAVSIWRELGVSAAQMWQTGADAYELDGGDGSVGIIDVLYRGDTDQIVIGRGSFKSPLLVKPIQATALLHLHTEYVVGRNGEPETVSRANLFVAFPSQTVEAAAKVISPVTNTVLDRNFEEIGLFIHMMSLAMRNQPGWVEELTGRLDGVLERRKPELLEVTARAYVANRRRQEALDAVQK